MKNNLVVFFIALSLGAAAQDLWPSLPWVGGKPPWLMSVALYYGAEREPWLALLSAVLAGLWLDGLSGEAIGVSAALLCASLPLICRLRRVFPAQGGRVMALAGAIVAPALLFATALVLRLSGGTMRPAWPIVFLRMLMAVPMGALLAGAVRPALIGLDRLTGNVSFKKDADAIEWS